LGATAAVQYQSSDASPIFVGATQDDSFKSVIATIATKAVGRSRIDTMKHSSNVGVEWRGLHIGTAVEVSPLELASRIQSISDAGELLSEAIGRHSERPVIVLDEFDAIADTEERNKFAHLLKHLGDQGSRLKFVFTGIASSLDQLLGAHLSAHRQVEQVELPRLGWEARREIVAEAANAFDLDLDDNLNWRIAMISDGFPYYAHLITERMIWEAANDPAPVERLAASHFLHGLVSAIASINAELKRPYEDAVTRRDELYEDVVWATADGDNLWTNLNDLYHSYKVIARKRARSEILERTKFSEKVRDLRKPSFGAILLPVTGRPAWYTYRERMLRGYVRMQAEANGIELAGERPAPRPRMHVPGNARTGSYGPSIPQGVRQNISLTRDEEK
jgi:hypothetical protein